MDDVYPAPETFDDDSPTTVTPDPVHAPTFALDPTEDSGPAPVLEVHQVWQDTVLDTVHARSGTVSAGHTTGFRWRLLGQDIAWVPRPLATVLPFVAPMISEVESRINADLHLSDPTLGDGAPRDLFVQRGGQWAALLHADWEAVLRDEDGVYALGELLESGRARPAAQGVELDLRPGDRLSVRIGQVDLHARLVPQAGKVATSLMDGFDPLFIGLVAMAGMMAACFGLIIYALPGDPTSSYIDLADQVGAMARPIVIEEQPTPEKVADGALHSPKRAKKAEGRRPTRKEPAQRNQNLAAQQRDHDIATNSGALGALQEAGIAAGFGGPIDSSALDNLNVIRGKRVADGNGLGDRLSGIGGGGQADGIGGFGPGCVPGETCGNSGIPGGTGSSALAGKRVGTIDANSEPPLLIGNMDRAQIEQVIKRNIAKFRYCYQRQLTRDPSLSGKVVTRFVIAGDGSVSKAETKSSTVSPAVDQCVARTMQRLSFPEPRGGGMAIVSYPFLFSAE